MNGSAEKAALQLLGISLESLTESKIHRFYNTAKHPVRACLPKERCKEDFLSLFHYTCLYMLRDEGRKRFSFRIST